MKSDSIRAKAIAVGMVPKTIPAGLQPILWSKSIHNIDIKKDKIYIIHQVLSYGSMDDIRLLSRLYSRDEIISIFKNYPKRIYTRPVFLYLRDFLLKIGLVLYKKDYVKNIARPSK